MSEIPINTESIDTYSEEKVVAFETYAERCNEGAHSRREGILSTDGYEEVLRDSRSLVAKSGMLLLGHIDHGFQVGYDVDRVKQLANAAARPDSQFFLATPFRVLSADEREELRQFIASQTQGIALFYSEHSDEDTGGQLASTFNDGGLVVKDIPLFDDRTDIERASLSMFSCNVDNVNPPDAPVPLRAVRDHFFTHKENAREGYEIMMGDELTEEQFGQFWQLFQDRFRFLGENHPISMEDTAEDIQCLLQHPDTLICVKYDDTKNPICFTFMIQDFDRLYWLNRSMLDEYHSTSLQNRTPLYFPGIVAAGEGGGYAAKLIDFFSEHTSAVRLSAEVYFENTNLSETYLPKIVYDILNQSPAYNVNFPQKLDQENYYLAQLMSQIAE